MDATSDRRPDLVSIQVVERLLKGPIVTIAIETDGVCFGLNEAYAPWWAAVGPSYMVEVHHIGHLFPRPDAQRPRGKVGRFEFQPVPVPLLVSFCERCCTTADEELDVP